MNNISIQDKKITQSTLLGIKWKNTFLFQETGIKYSMLDKNDK